MWFLEAFVSGFTLPTHEWRLQVFRIIIGAACLLKFSLALGGGGLQRYSSDGYPYYSLVKRHGEDRARIIARLYKPVVMLRIPAAASLMLGLYPKIAALLVLLALAYELLYNYRSNTTYLGLAVAPLLIAGSLGHGLDISMTAISSSNTWAQWLIVLITIDMYWNSAWIKARTPQFTSGLGLSQYLQVCASVKDSLPAKEYYFPKCVYTLIGDGSARAQRIWSVASHLTLAAEIALPVGLLVPVLTPTAFAVGIVLHTAFVFLSPRNIVGFSVGTVGSYVLFAN
ncbi:hypothetical protein [Microbispora sp. CA-102843]|uniref:hypothetical protein n=1 Tax=Microbispora sp. CA-102843 TaxID=3239952 RepID=UPI003D8F61A1